MGVAGKLRRALCNETLPSRLNFIAAPDCTEEHDWGGKSSPVTSCTGVGWGGGEYIFGSPVKGFLALVC